MPRAYKLFELLPRDRQATLIVGVTRYRPDMNRAANELILLGRRDSAGLAVLYHMYRTRYRGKFPIKVGNLL